MRPAKGTTTIPLTEEEETRRHTPPELGLPILRDELAEALTAIEEAENLATIYEIVTRVRTQIITELDRAIGQVEEMAEVTVTDPLTKAKNRNGYDKELKRLTQALKEHESAKTERETRRKTDTPDTKTENAETPPPTFVFIDLDIDHFKSVNDTYGHDAGDQVLREFANRIHARLREKDVLARMGGEEFRIIAPGTNGTTEILAEDIRLIIETEPFVLTDGTEINITVSQGISPYDENTDKMGLHSDEALYTAKKHGRNQVWKWTKGEHVKCTPHDRSEIVRKWWAQQKT